jgi:rhodanese-related sulfurtransferase
VGGSVSVEALLAAARSRLERVAPEEAVAAMRDGAAVVVDIRSESQRATDGVVPGAAFVARNVLEWRLDPESPWADPELARTDRRVIVMCNEGYQSSLVAATLQELGHADATDLAGGFQAWRGAGLPVEPDA